MTTDNEKIIPYRKKRNFNIGILIFGIIFIYLIATIILYITAPHVTVYEVRQGSILKDNAYTGLALREEMVVYTDEDGYVNYFAEENSKVRIGTKIYTLSNEELKFEEHTQETEVTLTDEEQRSLLLKIQAYNNQFQETDFSSTYQIKNELKNAVKKVASQSKSDQLDAMLLTQQGNNLSVKSAVKDGIVTYYVDGMEELSPEKITSEHLNKSNYRKNEFTNNKKLHSGDPVYKIITSDNWKLLIEVSEETKEALTDKRSVKVNFKKDNQEMRANISFLDNTDKPILCLSFHDSMIRYASDRYLDIELILEDESGLKIPKSAETTKDFYIVPNSYLTQGGNSNDDGVMRRRKTNNGETITEFLSITVYYEEDEWIYLDPNAFNDNDILVKTDSSETYQLEETRSLKGVYCINKGYAVFKQIKILCESDDYYIIEEGNSFGLSNYDHIALDSQSIKENDVVF